jgi:hypothetical protein
MIDVSQPLSMRIIHHLSGVLEIFAFTLPVGFWVLCAALIVIFRATSDTAWSPSRVIPCLGLLAFTFAIFMLGVLCSNPGHGLSPSQVVPADACLALALAQIVGSVVLVIRNRGMRVATAAICTLELWLGLCTFVVSGLAISGDSL